MIYHVSAAIGIAMHRLCSAERIGGARDESLFSWLRWCLPVKFPKTPRVEFALAKQLRIGPRCATIRAQFDFRDFRIARPCASADTHATIGRHDFVFRRTRN